MSPLFINQNRIHYKKITIISFCGFRSLFCTLSVNSYWEIVSTRILCDIFAIPINRKPRYFISNTSSTEANYYSVHTFLSHLISRGLTNYFNKCVLWRILFLWWYWQSTSLCYFFIYKFDVHHDSNSSTWRVLYIGNFPCLPSNYYIKLQSSIYPITSPTHTTLRYFYQQKMIL